MAGSVSALVYLERANGVSGQHTAGHVKVSNNATGQPVTVSNIILYTSPNGVPVDFDAPQLGGGGGGAGYNTVPSTIPVTVNNNASLQFPIRAVLYGALAPGASPVNAQIGAVVTLSDGSVVTATPAQLTVYPLMKTVSDGGVLTPLQNKQPTAGQADHASTLNSNLLPLLGV